MTEKKLAQLIETLDAARMLITMDIYYCIYDTDCIVKYIYPEDGDKDGIHVGTRFHDPTGKLYEVLATEKCIHNFIPLESLGFVMEGNIIPVYDNGELCGAISSAYVPMNQQQLAARELAVESIYHLILSVDMKNTHCQRLYFNYEVQQFPADAQHFDDFCEKCVPDIHPEDVVHFQKFTELSGVWKTLQNEKTIMMECRLRSVSREYRWAELIFTRIEEFDGAGTYNTAVFMVRDIHERKSKELKILQKNHELIVQLEKNNILLFEQGMTDELTKLNNRKGFEWFGEGMLQEAKAKDRYIYAMIADLNGLKYINDKFGHEEGDKAIRVISDILRKVAPESAIVSRTGGDEFNMMTLTEKDSPLPMEIEQRFVQSMKDFNQNSGLPYMVEASYGWDLRPASEVENLDECLKRADYRMYIMKSERKMSVRLSGETQRELFRRFGSAKQKVLVLSRDEDVHTELSRILDSGCLLLFLETVEEALKELDDKDEMVTVFVDSRLDGQNGAGFIQELPESLRRNVILVLLLEKEDSKIIAEAFEMGIDDVLIKPYDTVLNRCRISQLCRLNIVNRKISQMLEQKKAL